MSLIYLDVIYIDSWLIISVAIWNIGKKNEETYKHVVEISFKLTIEEAKFREIQVTITFSFMENDLELVWTI